MRTRQTVRPDHDSLVRYDRRAGLVGIISHPGVLVALDPRYGFAYLFGHGTTGFLGSAPFFLRHRGGSALRRHGAFRRPADRFAWYGLVLPCLLLNYAGQTAIVVDGGAGANPFFSLCPDAWQVPLVGLATIATIIASQSIISGAFSMTRQAIQLGLCPRLHILRPRPPATARSTSASSTGR